MKAQVDHYNTFCKSGDDAELLKPREWLIPSGRPPYNTIKALKLIDSVFGGIRNDHEMKVLNKNFKPIGGLFTAGIATSGWVGPGGLGGFDGFVPCHPFFPELRLGERRRHCRANDSSRDMTGGAKLTQDKYTR